MKILEGLSEQMRKALKEQLKYNVTNLNSICKIATEFLDNRECVSLDDSASINVAFEKTDIVCSNTTNNNKNILEMDNAFNSAA